MYHGGVGSFYYNLWAPEGTVWLQEDSAALLSPDIFEKHIMPYIKKQIAAFKGCIVHMHPTGFYPYKQFLQTDMLGLELHIDQGGPNAEQLFDVHKEILSKKPLIIWGQIPDEDLDWIFSKLPSQGLAVLLALDSQDDAKKYIKMYSEYLQR